MAKKRIGILTGGGDVPGLNGVIKGVTYRAARARLRGRRHPPWLGGPDPPEAGQRPRTTKYVVPLDLDNTRTIDRTGGTWLHSSRTNPRKMKKAALPAHLDAKQAPSR